MYHFIGDINMRYYLEQDRGKFFKRQIESAYPERLLELQLTIFGTQRGPGLATCIYRKY